MKKVLCFILVLIMCLSLCACNHEAETADEIDNSVPSSEQNGDNSANTVPTKDEMLAVASELDFSELSSLTSDHIAKAKNEYCNKTFQFFGQIAEIAEDHIEFGSGFTLLKVYLPLDDILLLECGQYVTVVGQISDTIDQENDSYGGTEYQYSMNTAYVVSDRVEITGKILSERSSKSGYMIYLPETTSKKQAFCVIFWADDVSAEQYVEKEVHISARQVNNTYYDATVIEIVE